MVKIAKWGMLAVIGTGRKIGNIVVVSERCQQLACHDNPHKKHSYHHHSWQHRKCQVAFSFKMLPANSDLNLLGKFIV